MFGDVAFAQSPFASLGGKAVLADLSDSAVAASQSSAESNFGGEITEQAAVTDSIFNANSTLLALISELASAAAAQTNTASMRAIAAETAVASAAQTPTASMLASLSESAIALDSSSAQATLLAFVLEAVTAADEFTGSRVFAAAVSESATGADAQSVRVVFSGTVAELARAVATSTAVKTKNVPVTGVQLYVAIGGTLVWAQIDDTQSPNWQNVSNAQIPGWQSVDDTQIPGWNNLPS